MQWDTSVTPASQASLTAAAVSELEHGASQLTEPQLQQPQPILWREPAPAVRPLHAAAAVQADSAAAEHQQLTDPAQSELTVSESLVEGAILELQGHTGRYCTAI